MKLKAIVKEICYDFEVPINSVPNDNKHYKNLIKKIFLKANSY